MSAWEHLSEVPDEVRATMARAFTPWDKQDLGVESHLEALYSQGATEVTCRTLRSAANRSRVPVLVATVAKGHPELSRRAVFCAVGLFLGLSEKHVQDLVYRPLRRRP